MKTALEKIKTKEAKVAVIGLGYVGLPLALEISQAGFTTIGIDTSEEKIRSLQAGNNYVRDIDTAQLREAIHSKQLIPTTSFATLEECDFISICVPTPLGKGKVPDVSYIVSAVGEVKKYLKGGQTVILESTTYPGTTEEVVLPLLEESGLKVGTDFHLAFSPERTDPGNKTFFVKNTPKVMGGITPNCTESAQALYETFIDHVVTVSSARAAEMVKILENTFRAINIGLANEIAIMCDHLEVDTWEVIDAAATKPFGFMPFYPGPGLGGHCIPVDPHYLVWKMKLLDYNPRFIQLADEINSSMPHLIVDKIVDGLNAMQRAVNGSRVLVLGVAYKKDVDDYRESPALDVIYHLQKKSAEVDYYDPHVSELKVNGFNLTSITSLADIADYDCVVLLTDHSEFDVADIVERSRLIVDTRNMTRNIRSHKEKIIKF